MKKIFTYSLGALLLTTTLSLGSCKSQADDDLTRRTEQSINQGTPVVFTFDMESLPEQDARALTIESQTANGKNAGIKLKWVEGDKETIHLLFKQGTKTEVVTATMTIGSYNESTKRYEGKFEAVAPTTINLADGGVTVAGAMGVTELTYTGEATIESSKFFGEADRFMTLPMYFTERPVNFNGEKYVADMTLHFFGSVVGVTVSNVDGNMTYSPHEVTFKTEAFTTEGKMNILTASEAKNANPEVLPAWTTEQTATTEQRVNFDHGDIKIGEKKTLFFWVHPSTYTGTKTLKLDVRTDNFDDNLGATDPEVTKNFNVKPLSQRRVHRIAQELQAPKGDLIISEGYMAAINENAIWEFHNPTEEAIDLTKYTMQRFDYNGGYSSTPTWESPLINEENVVFKRWWILFDNRTATKMKGWMLPPHKSIVFYASTTTASDAEKKVFGKRPGLTAIINFYSAGSGLLRIEKYGMAFRVPNYSRHALAKDGKIVDNFFYGDGTTKYSIPAGNFMRKPGRNLPRKTMKIDIKNSDWVVRENPVKDDIGYRYSYYFDRDRTVTELYGNHWLEDDTNKLTSHSNDGHIKSDKLYNVDYAKDASRSSSSISTMTKTLYTPPTWWTKARAQAADR